MTLLRRALAPLTAVWLICQIGTPALVPVAFWSHADPHAAECTCGHGGGAMWCPMHHKTAAGSTECAMKAPNAPDSAVLTMLMGVAGLLPEATPVVVPAVPTARPRLGDARVRGERPVPPDPPPPRT